MKPSKLLFILGVGSLIFACKKETTPPLYSVASLNVVHALPTSAPLILVPGSTSPVQNIIPGTDILYQNFTGVAALSYASNAVLTLNSGSDTFYAVQQNADTSTIGSKAPNFMFNGVLSLKAGSLYSLFITGKDTTAPDSLFVLDIPPVHTDSTTGIRFVNLSANSNQVSVDIQGMPNGSEVSNLAYKGITDFKNYAATSNINSYTFEFRDVATGTLLASYTLNGVNNNDPTSMIPNTVLFRNMTIALIGQPTGGTVPQQCIQINNF
jgi:hypothetical protein